MDDRYEGKIKKLLLAVAAGIQKKDKKPKYSGTDRPDGARYETQDDYFGK